MQGDYKKITQILNYLIRKDSSSLDFPVLKLMKLVWAADRYHLRKYGRTVSQVKYVTMFHGPVPSLAKDIAESTDYLNRVDKNAKQYSQQFITYSKATSKEDDDTDRSIRPVDESELSQTDKEALDFAWNNFGEYDSEQLVGITHKYPEWKKLGPQVSRSNRRAPMNLLDFFEDPKGLKNDPFAEDKALLNSSKEMFLEYA